MTASLHTLPVSGDARERVTLSVAEIAEIVVKAQEAGYKDALRDAKVDDRLRNRLVTNLWATYNAREDHISAQIMKWLARPACSG